MTSTDPRGDSDDNPVKALLRSGVRGILGVTLAVVITGVVAAVIAVAVAATY